MENVYCQSRRVTCPPPPVGGCLLGVNSKQEARDNLAFKLLCPKGGVGRRERKFIFASDPPAGGAGNKGFNTFYNSLITKCRSNGWLGQRPWIKQFIKFSIAGGACMILDFLIYFVLTRLFSFWASHLAWTNFLSACSAATVNFIWNRNWTFRSYQNPTAQYLKFWVVVLGGLVIYQVLFFVLVDQLRFFDLLGKAIAAAIVWIIRFIFNKFWSFK